MLDALQVASGRSSGIVYRRLGEIVRPHPWFATRDDERGRDVSAFISEQCCRFGVEFVSVLEAADTLGQGLPYSGRRTGVGHDIGVVFVRRPHRPSQFLAAHLRTGQVLPFTRQASVYKYLHVIGSGLELFTSRPVKLVFALGLDARRAGAVPFWSRNGLAGTEESGAFAPNQGVLLPSATSRPDFVVHTADRGYPGRQRLAGAFGRPQCRHRRVFHRIRAGHGEHH